MEVVLTQPVSNQGGDNKELYKSIVDEEIEKDKNEESNKNFIFISNKNSLKSEPIIFKDSANDSNQQDDSRLSRATPKYKLSKFAQNNVEEQFSKIQIESPQLRGPKQRVSNISESILKDNSNAFSFAVPVAKRTSNKTEDGFFLVSKYFIII